VSGGAYFGMAVLYDNLGKATKAMEFYRRFLQVHMKDKSGVGDMKYRCMEAGHGADEYSCGRV
jgi:predicted enzyme related to lactoylglutathione lyase